MGSIWDCFLKVRMADIRQIVFEDEFFNVDNLLKCPADEFGQVSNCMHEWNPPNQDPLNETMSQGWP